jgi:hypothetical protein
MRLRSRRSEADTVAPEVYPIETEDVGQMPDHALHLDNEMCARCARPITPHDEARRTAKGEFVHLSC